MVSKGERLSALTTAPPQKDISIVLPACNEASRIEKCLREVEQVLSAFSNSYEIIVAEDGSTDGTYHILKKLAENKPQINVLHSPVRLGKGKAIKNALRSAKGEIIVFMDADLSASLEFLPRIVQLAKEKCGLAIGSRHVKGSRVHRPFTRALSSLTYNLCARILFLDGIRDHQCGFKAMNRKAAQIVQKNVKANGFFLDTEMILQCKRRGVPVVEVAVDWTETKKKNESDVKLFRDAARMGRDLLRFRLNINDP
ncbi:MAG: glycosyltransferase family 2 protein [Candidatus Bathyarchaeota archaeon]|nr:glycosyltransferase family 2 protein [Candidatus Bathyarchaeota archaeon]